MGCTYTSYQVLYLNAVSCLRSHPILGQVMLLHEQGSPCTGICIVRMTQIWSGLALPDV